MNNNKIKMMSVNDMQGVYGGEVDTIDGGTLPEVEVTGDIDLFYKHIGEVAGKIGEDAASKLIYNYYYYLLFCF